MSCGPKIKKKLYSSNILQTFGLNCLEGVQDEQPRAREIGLNVTSTAKCGIFQKAHSSNTRPLGLATN